MKKQKQLIVLVYAELPMLDQPRKEFRLQGALYGEVAPILTAMEDLREALASGPTFRKQNQRYRIEFSVHYHNALVFPDEAAMNRAIALWKRQRMHCGHSRGTLKYRLEKVNLQRKNGEAANLKLSDYKTRKFFNSKALAKSNIETDTDKILATGLHVVNFTTHSSAGLPLNSISRNRSPRQQRRQIEQIFGNRIRIR